MNKIIDRAESISLSSEDLLRMCNEKVNIFTYPELAGVDSYEELFTNGNDNCIVLYETRLGYGHWVCLLRYPTHIEFFDPLGWMMDTELGVIDEYYRSVLDEIQPHLTYLLKNVRVISNTTALQKESAKVNTCGRHACVRIRFRGYGLKDYVTLFKNKNADQIVTMLTYLL